LIAKLQSRLQKPYLIKEQSIKVTASFGFAVYPTDATTQHDLIRLADISMYRDKSDNRRSDCFINYNNIPNLSKTNSPSLFRQRYPIRLGLLHINASFSPLEHIKRENYFWVHPMFI
jgi:hypothetical protein